MTSGLYKVDGRGRPLTEEDRRIAIKVHTRYRDECGTKYPDHTKEQKEWMRNMHNNTVHWLSTGPLGDLRRYPRDDE